MKIAIFSDIHANLPALEAVLKDIDAQKPDNVYCLGDLVGYNVWPNDVSRMIRERKIPTIAGNYDEGVGNNSDDCGCAYKSDEEKANGALSISYTNEAVDDDVREFLKQLPRHICLQFNSANDPLSLLMVHGSPRKINEYLFEDRPEKSLLRMMETARADIMLFGHTHKPYHRPIKYEKNGKVAFRHAINTGSVGKPKDGDSRASYVILNWDNLNIYDVNSLTVEIRKIEYDVEKAASAVEESPLPNAFAAALRNGG